MESCALCLQPQCDTDGSRRYRKLLYGKANSCSNELAILNRLIFATWPGLSVNSFEKLTEEKAYYCAHCQRNLINYNKAVVKVNQLSSDILSNLSAPPQTELSCSRPHTGEKRSAETAQLGEPDQEREADENEAIVSNFYVPVCSYTKLSNRTPHQQYPQDPILQK